MYDVAVLLHAFYASSIHRICGGFCFSWLRNVVCANKSSRARI